MNKLCFAKFTVGLAVVLSPFFMTEFAHADSDRDATPEERARVVEILQQQGCTVVEDVDYIEGVGFEAEDVICNDGKEYDIFLDENLNIVSQQEDFD